MELNSIVVKESPGLCRCCLSEGCYKDLATEYPWMSETEVYADMLLECFDISITQNSEGPNGPKRLICEVCITRLRDACNFKKQVLNSEKKFVDMVARKHFQPKAMLVYEAHEPMKTEIDLEPMPGTSGDLEDVEYLEEDIEYVDDYREETIEDIQEQDITVSELEVKPKKSKKRSVEGKAEKKHKTQSTAINKYKGTKINTVEDKYKKTEQARKVLIKRQNVEYVLQYSNVTPFLWYKGRYRCFYCIEPIKDPDQLREHTNNTHKFENLELVVHDRLKNNRNKDAAVKIDVLDMSCKLCAKPIANLDQLIHHLIIAHDAEYDMTIHNCLLPFKLHKDSPSCPTCDQKFVSFEYLLRHANKHHLQHNYKCEICSTSFQGENHMKMHNRYYHRDGGYTCDYCGIGLSNLSKKVLHEKNIHLANLSTCPRCPETFKSPYLKKQHLANVHAVEELRIKCPYCSKVYPQVSIMSRHMRRVHLREKNVSCEICGDQFFGPYDLKLHMVKHNGEKKYICTVCGKKFSKRSNLNTHMFVHTGKKDNVCEICRKGFTHHFNLKMHIKNKHSEYMLVEEASDGRIEVLHGEIITMEDLEDCAITL